MFMAILGAAAQAMRTAGQKRLTTPAGPIGASFMRFCYAIPFSCAWLGIWLYGTSATIPSLPVTFWFWVLLASLLQIGFTVTLVLLLQLRNFAAGVAFSKTEVLQAAIFEAILVGYIASLHTVLAIIIGCIAVLLLSSAQGALYLPDLVKRVASRVGLLGLSSGTFLGSATVCYSIASSHLISDDYIMRASLTAAIATILQTAMMIPVMLFLAKDQLYSAFRLWRPALFIGVFSSLSTISWFVAFALHYVGPARAIGQIELVISLLISGLFFKETIRRTEYIAIALLSLSVLIILLS